MKISQLRKELKKFKAEHGDVEVIIAGYEHDERCDGVEAEFGMNPKKPPVARLW